MARSYSKSPLNRIGLKVAAVVAAAVAAAAVPALGLGGLSVWGGLTFVALAAAAAYGAVQVLIARRLELARATLRQARQRRFGALSGLRTGAERDELDALIRQVYRAGRTLQREIERMERVESYRREFLGNVSHELKTPIFVIAGCAEQLLDGALDDPRIARNFVGKIERNAARLEALARDLLAISRIETGELTMTVAPFALPRLVAEVTEALETVAASHGVTVLTRLPEHLPPVLGDREQLQQVLTNLVQNAVHYNRPGGHVEISARPVPAQKGRPERVRVTVVDDGLGIPQEAIPRLTERFFRLDQSRSRGAGGTGLGLAIVKHVLEAHGGKLEVESREGYGSSFSFALPVAPAT